MEVGDSYFETMRIPMLSGRAPTARDDQRSPWIAVINSTMAKQYFSGENSIGRRIFISILADSGGRTITEDRPREIVGVVRDARRFHPDQPPPAMIYVPVRQHMRDYPGGTGATHLAAALVVRTRGNPLALAATIRKVTGAIDRTQVVAKVESMDQATDERIAQFRIFTEILGFVSSLAIVLAAGGIYGVVSYTVSRRTHEIGVRIALGAGSRDVLALVLKQGAKLVAPGILVGLAGAYAATRLLGSLLYDVSPTDTATFSIVAVLLTAIALAACYVPARRAMGVDPVQALRNE